MKYIEQESRSFGVSSLLINSQFKPKLMFEQNILPEIALKISHSHFTTP